MQFRKKIWFLYKKLGDSAIYAKCRCGFEYCCSSVLLPESKVSFKKFYNYCPNCGKKYRTDIYLADRMYFK